MPAICCTRIRQRCKVSPQHGHIFRNWLALVGGKRYRLRPRLDPSVLGRACLLDGHSPLRARRRPRELWSISPKQQVASGCRTDARNVSESNICTASDCTDGHYALWASISGNNGASAVDNGVQRNCKFTHGMKTQAAILWKTF